MRGTRPSNCDAGSDSRRVSVGGVALATAVKLTTRHVYLAFEGVTGTAGLAVLVQITRTERQGDEVFVGGQYRLDLASDFDGE